MYGIAIERGINNCYWNIEGQCTNRGITGNERSPDREGDYGSSQYCERTIFQSQNCRGHKPTV